MKYISRSTTKTTVKVFGITDLEPMQIGYYKTPTLINRLVVTYVEGKDGLKKTSWIAYGSNVLKDGSAGQLRRDIDDEYYFKRVPAVTWPQEIADKNAPWAS